MKFFDLEELLLLHHAIIEDYGGSHGVRNEGRLESALASPAQEVFGKQLYPTVFEKAAVYARSIIGDHPFVDGNKRTAITLASLFLIRNGYELTAPSKELEDFAVQIAVENLDIPTIAAWLKSKAKL